MNRVACIALLSFSLMGCMQPFDPAHLAAMAADIPKFSNIEDAWFWVDENITYRSDSTRPWYDQFQTPEETLEWRTGDCEDFCILLMYFAHELGIETRCVMFRLNGVLHAVVECEGRYLEVQRSGYYYTWETPPLFTVLAGSYEEAIYVARTRSAK